MACDLLDAKPLSEPILAYCRLNPSEQTSLEFSLKFKKFHSKKCIWKCCLQKWRPSCLSLNVLITVLHYACFTVWSMQHICPVTIEWPWWLNCWWPGAYFLQLSCGCSLFSCPSQYKDTVFTKYEFPLGQPHNHLIILHSENQYACISKLGQYPNIIKDAKISF